MEQSNFFALAFRQKYIERWQLMRSTIPDSLSTHVCEVAMLTHALAELGNTQCGASYDAGKAVLLALYHDLPEVLTGDLPTPIKYFSAEMRQNYKQIEAHATAQLLDKLPAELQKIYAPLLSPNADDLALCKLIKAADKLSALIKCIEEEKGGNAEFGRAKEETLRSLTELKCPEADLFCTYFLPAFSKTLDEL